MTKYDYIKRSLNTELEKDLFRENKKLNILNNILLTIILIMIFITSVFYIQRESAERHVVAVLDRYENLLKITDALAQKQYKK